MLHNTPQTWGAVAKGFHWSMAALVLAQFPLGWAAVSWPLSPLKLDLFVWHKSLGVLVLALLVLRLGWRLFDRRPQPLAGTPVWERLAAAADHWGLYFLTAALPLSGWVISSAAAIPFRVFWLFPLPRLVEPDKAVEELAKAAHLLLSFVLAALLAAHIAAALWHHWVRKDEVLVRMWLGRRR